MICSHHKLCKVVRWHTEEFVLLFCIFPELLQKQSYDDMGFKTHTMGWHPGQLDICTADSLKLR